MPARAPAGLAGAVAGRVAPGRSGLMVSRCGASHGAAEGCPVGRSNRAASEEEIVSTAERLFDDVPASALTEDQRGVALLIAGGASNREIAERLGLQRHTFSHHVA